MNQSNERGLWPNDDTPQHAAPADVQELVNIDNQLAALGLRGLASNNSKELRQAFATLAAILNASYRRGLRKGIAIAAAAAGSAWLAWLIVIARA